MRRVAEGLRARLPAAAQHDGIAARKRELVALDVDDPHRPSHLVRAVVADLDLDLGALHVSREYKIACDIVCYRMGVVEDRVPLYVRLPRAQANALDRLVDATGRRKQQLVSDLLGDRLQLGYAEVLDQEPAAASEVLTLEELAALLRVDAAAVLERAERGELPGRRFGSQWRFDRQTVLAWLAEGERTSAPDG